jgi:hypothetical protein
VLPRPSSPSYDHEGAMKPQVVATLSEILRPSLIQIRGPQSPARKQSARVPLRNSDLTSAMMADGCQRLWQPATSPAPRPMEAVRCIRWGELRGLVPIPYVALQDTRHGHPGGNPSGHHSTLPDGGWGPAGVRSPSDRMFM